MNLLYHCSLINGKSSINYGHYNFSLPTWHVLLKAGQFDPESRRRPPDASYAKDVRSPRSQDGHPRVVYAAWPVPCLSSY